MSIIKKITKLNKPKINLILIFQTISIIILIYYKTDSYLTNVLTEQTSHIIATNIVNPFEEETTEETTEENKVETISYTKTNNALTSTWSWPTTNNYTITTYYSTSHQAIDIYSYDGYNSNIYAVGPGEVVTVKSGCIAGDLYCNSKGGNYIIIKHNENNYYTVYMHLNQIYVSPGTKVSSNDIIATMGNTGNVIPVPTTKNPYNGTHLHFAVYIGVPFQGGYTINPLTLYN